MPGSGSAWCGTSSGSLAGHEATGHIDPVERKEGDAVDKAVVLLVGFFAAANYGPDLLDIGVTNQDHVLFVQEVEFALGGARGTDVDALLAMRRCDKFSLNLCLCGLMPRFRG